jgi:hypothetical protein
MEITPTILQAALEEWRGLWDKGEGEFLEAEAKAYKARTGMDPPEGWPALRDNVDAREYSLVVEPLLWELLAKAFKAWEADPASTHFPHSEVCAECGGSGIDEMRTAWEEDGRQWPCEVCRPADAATFESAMETVG